MSRSGPPAVQPISDGPAGLSLLDEPAPEITAITAAPSPPSWRARRRARRRARTMQDKATRASWRAVTVAVVPPTIAAVVTYWLWRTGKPVEEIGAGAAATSALIMVGSPFVLWWSVSALRRGTRRMVLSLLTGFYSGTLMVLLVAGGIAVAAGYTLLTGNAVPYVGWRLEIPGGIR